MQYLRTLFLVPLGAFFLVGPALAAGPSLSDLARYCEQADGVVAPACAAATALAEQVPEAKGQAPDLTQMLKANAPAVMERMNAAIAQIGVWVESGEIFAKKQVPLLVQEILWWATASSAFWVVLGVILLAISGALTMLAIRRWAVWKEERAEIRQSWTVGLAIGGVFIGSLCVVINIMSMLKPIIAPRLYLIEFFREMAK